MKTNDISVYFPPPPPATLPPVGATLTDPVFGTIILRVTDQSKTANAVIGYSAIYDAFNADSSHLAFFGSNGDGFLCDVDPVGFTVSNWRRWNGMDTSKAMFWSRTDPDKAFALVGTTISTYSVKADKWTILTDIARLFPAGFVYSTSRGFAKDESRLMIVPEKADFTPLNNAIAVYDFKADKLVFYKENMPNTKGSMSGDGTMLMSASGPTGFIWGVDSGLSEPVTEQDPDWIMQHGDWGVAVWGMDIPGYRPGIRQFTQQNLTPVHSPKPTGPLGPSAGVAPGRTWTQSSHYSLRSKDESLLTSSYFTNLTNAADAQNPAKNSPCPFMDEVFQLSNDPTQPLINRRYCHHQATPWAGYWHQPHANISQDSRLIAFVSSFGSPTTDVWLIQTGIQPPNPPATDDTLAGVQFSQDEAQILKTFAEWQLSLKPKPVL